MHLDRRDLLGAALLAAVALPGRAASAQPLRIGAIVKLPTSWVCAQLLTDFCRELRQPLQILPMPAPRAAKASLSGEVDGDLMRIASYGQNYPELVRVEPSYYRISGRAFSMRARNARIRSKEDLAHYSVATIRGVAWSNDLTENHPALTLTQDTEQVFRMLQAGRIDAVLQSTLSARIAIEKLGIEDEVVVSPELVAVEVFVYLHVKRKDIAPRLGAVIGKMKASGELARLTASYENTVNSALVESFRDGAYVTPPTG